MIKVAICDDEYNFLIQIQKMIESYLNNKGVEYEIDIFNSGKELLSIGGGLVKYTVIFLDINMKEIDGMQVAKKIRIINKQLFLVFITAYIKYSLEGYKVNAIRYLLKDNRSLAQSINECLDAIFLAIDYKDPKKVLEFKEGIMEVNVDKIIYIESYRHIVNYHIINDGEDAIYTRTAALNDVEEDLKEFSFLRIHQSFLVNIKHIRTINSYRAILDNGVILPIPKVKYRAVKEQYAEYKGKF